MPAQPIADDDRAKKADPALAAKTLLALRTSRVPKIDAVPDDSCWQSALVAGDFVQRELNPGQPSLQKTEVRILYDDEAIYLSATLFDTAPDSILHELSTRDNEANADLFGVFFDTYNDDINAYGFFVTAAGTQIDARYGSDGQDFDWNAVWISSVKINATGWCVEMKIPYSALRFSKKEVQTWGCNFIRKIRRTRETSFWNPLNPLVGSLVRQFGDLAGLSDIKPPVRLSFTPYVAGILNHYPYNDPNISNLTYNASGGMDVKYGLSDAFTLDMTLIPDFSQVQSDNQVLNLSPFEVQFQERRPFFTEGTELFNKGGLFYSRRVGGTPIGYYDAYANVKDGEKIIKNPSQTQLLNATKLSGRTAGKLGIGLFNAIGNEMYAVAQDTSGNTRKILTSPYTNYNILVFDQALKNNSSVSLVNTNVTRDGHYYDANVTGTQFRFNNKANMYSVGGAGVVSNRFFPDSAKPYTGYAANLDFGKSGGNFLWNVFGSVKSDRYNINDLGILFLSNNVETGLSLNYNVYKPFWKVNHVFNNLFISYQRMFSPNAFWNFGIYGNHRTTFSKRFLTCGIHYGLEPVTTYDYYEPRVANRFYTFPVNYNGGGFISTDYRKKLAIDLSASYRVFEENERNYLNIWFSPRYRVNNKLSFVFEFSRNTKHDDMGCVNPAYRDSIAFGRRNMVTVSNTLSGVYKFTNKMSLSFRVRHYWSKAAYAQYYRLGEDGYLYDYDSYAGNHNVSFNAFNIDMVFFWQFAPGSELNLVWKNSLLKRDPLVDTDYYDNFRTSLNSPQNNMISLKVLYYLDYLRIRKAFSNKQA
jgi:hypothetical protein